mmetsp:Transcript_38477/g.115235  ORF Transcript_38477/g.115235 Transcript_38477/m.115235 type:complete len:224 (+) Transcript_38477:67-738(+)
MTTRITPGNRGRAKSVLLRLSGPCPPAQAASSNREPTPALLAAAALLLAAAPLSALGHQLRQRVHGRAHLGLLALLARALVFALAPPLAGGGLGRSAAAAGRGPGARIRAAAGRRRLQPARERVRDRLARALACSLEHVVVGVVVEALDGRRAGRRARGGQLLLLALALRRARLPLPQPRLCVDVPEPPAVEVAARVKIGRLDALLAGGAQHRAKTSLTTLQP